MIMGTKISFLLALACGLQLASADTLKVSVFSKSQSGCAGGPNFQTPQQSFTIGNVGPCYATAQPFFTVTTRNVAQSFFGRNLRVLACEGTSCSGNPEFQTGLTNTSKNCCDSTLVNLCSCNTFGKCKGQTMQTFKVDTRVQ